MKNKLEDGRQLNIFWANNILFDKYGQIIGSNALLIYLCLARHANAKGTSFPSIKKIATECGLKSRTTVTAALKILAEKKLISIKNRGVKNTGFKTTNFYTLLPIKDVQNMNMGDVQNMNMGDVQNMNNSCSKYEHKGLQDKDYKLKDRQEGQSVVFPKGLSANTKNVNILNKLKDDKSKQQVVDVVGQAIAEGKIKTNISGYLSQVTQNYLDGDFTPLTDKINGHNITECPYCDKKGIIRLSKPNGNNYQEECLHNNNYIQSMREKGHTIRMINK